MVVPPQHLLTATLQVGAVQCALDWYEMTLKIDGLDLADDRTWRTAVIPHTGLSFQLHTPAFGMRGQVAPKDVGLSKGSPEDDETSALLVTELDMPRYAPARLTVASATRTGPLRFALHFEGTFPSGRPFVLDVAGEPTLITTDVLGSGGQAAAEELFARMLPGVDVHSDAALSEFVLGDEGDQTFSLRWQRPAVAALIAAAETAERERREIAKNGVPPPSGPPPEPTADAPLVAGHTRTAVERAMLTLSVWTEATGAFAADQVRVQVSFEVEVDEHSGEDGALAPTIEHTVRALPYVLPLASRAVEDLVAVELDSATEAWFGNDAPELTENAFAFALHAPDRARVQWRAQYDDWTTRSVAALRFDGDVEVAPIRVQAPDAAALRRAVALAFGPEALTAHALSAPQPGTFARVPVVTATLTLRMPAR